MTGNTDMLPTMIPQSPYDLYGYNVFAFFYQGMSHIHNVGDAMKNEDLSDACIHEITVDWMYF